MTSQDAKRKMLDWAEGKHSHWNEFNTWTIEGANQAIAECAKADAAEVIKWSTVFTALLKEEELSNVK